MKAASCLPWFHPLLPVVPAKPHDRIDDARPDLAGHVTDRRAMLATGPAPDHTSHPSNQPSLNQGESTHGY